jgi:hypothetical protein
MLAPLDPHVSDLRTGCGLSSASSQSSTGLGGPLRRHEHILAAFSLALLSPPRVEAILVASVTECFDRCSTTAVNEVLKGNPHAFGRRRLFLPPAPSTACPPAASDG